MSDHDDRQILSRIKAGDKQAFGDLIKKYQKLIFNIMLRTTQNTETAADLTQDTFLKLYTGLDRFDHQKRLFPWLYTIGINTARDYSRKHRIETRVIMNEAPYEHGPILFSKTPFPPDDNPGEAINVTAALLKLSVDDREILMRHYKDEWTCGEIAETFSISISAAKMRVHRALEKFRSLLE